MKKRGFLAQSTQYFRLLVSADPKPVDIVLLVIGFVSSIAAGVPFPLIGILFGQLVDDLNSADCAITSSENVTALTSQVTDKVLKVVYIGIANFALIYIYTVSWNIAGERLAQRLREKYFRSLLRQDATFFDNLPAGEVSSRVSNDISTIQRGTSEKTGIFLGSVSFFITAYVVAFTRNAKLAGFLVSLFPAYVLMGLISGFFVEKFAATTSTCVASATAIALEALSSITVVHAFAINDKLEALFATDLAAARLAGIRKGLSSAIQAGLLYFIAYSANGLAFWQGSKAISESVENPGTGTTVGKTYTVIFILVDASLILSQVAPFVQFFNSAAAAFSKLESDMEHHSTINGTTNATGTFLGEVKGHIRLDKTSFAYPSRSEVTVLNQASIDCPAGSHTAIVGLSGSGKSTIAGLIARLYDPIAGNVYLDGHNLRDLNVRDLRRHLSVVYQDPSLLDRSVLENIAHGLINSVYAEEFDEILLTSVLPDTAASVRDGEDLHSIAKAYGSKLVHLIQLIEQAADLADVTTFIKDFKHGFGTIVGSKGTLVSAGQEQRISIARALVKNPRILVLDEATASLDSSTEIRIQRAMERFAKGRTLITIAHRLSTIRNADSIVVMSNGSVLEQGTHVQLMSLDGHYAHLSSLQGSASNNKNNLSSGSQSFQQKSSVGDITDVSNSNSAQSIPDEKMLVSEVRNIPPVFKSPDDPLAVKRSNWFLSQIVAALFRPYALVVLFAFTGAIVVGGAYSGSAVIFGNTVGDLSPCEPAAEIRSAGKFWGLMFFVLAIVELFANILSFSAFGWLTEAVLYKVRILSLRSLLFQDLHWHESNDRSPATLLSFITDDCNTLGSITGSVLGVLVSISVNLVAAIILTLIIAWKLALVCLSVVPLILGVGYAQLVVLSRFATTHQKAFADSIGILTEAINSFKIVTTLSIEEQVLQSYRHSLKGPTSTVTKKSMTANFWLAAAYGLPNFVYSLAYWWGFKLVSTGEYSQKQFFIVVIALLVSSQLWGQMFALAPDIVKARVSINRVVNLLQISPENDKFLPKHQKSLSLVGSDVEKLGSGINKISSRGGVSVDLVHVFFAYPARPDITVLRDLTIKVRPGQFCALVGPSGAGKTTILTLIERMYRPRSGKIEIDGYDILHHESTSFRDDIALVPKDAMLFQGTIAFNVGLGAKPGMACTQAQIEQACQLANIHDVIVGLPDGYNTQCGPNGNRLSGGQKQRLSIARALLRRPRLLLLDEPTSALDAESERLLQDGIDRISKDTTVVAVAHRLNTIKRADTIFLIEAGRCVDQGTHSELYDRSESYRTNALHQAIDA